jgi:hypothetical protein
MLVFVGVFVVALGVDRAMTAGAGPSLRGLEPTVREVSSDVIQSARASFAPPPDQHFVNCSAAHAAGRFSIPAGDPSYRERMDGDGDGFACEPYS